MTRQEALVEARKRWGPDAILEYVRKPRHRSLLSYSVGYRSWASFWLGNGDTWESALADADRRRK